jgi:DNA-binding response OmpR family regulator
MLSARDMGDDIETALKYNADWYIVKPYDEKYLMERIRSFLEPAESTVASGTDVFPGKYRHYKGNYYQVIAVARHSETEEEMVVYRKLYDDFSWWVRPKKMFIETIMINDTPVRRFLYIGPIDPP